MKKADYTFKKFIAQFRQMDTPSGDLARDIFLDEKFPETHSYNIIHRYFENLGVSESCLDAFDQAYIGYLRTGGEPE